MLKKGIHFQWTSVAAEAFQILKQKLIHAPVLALPDFSKPFTVETDASDLGIGAVLMQEGHPIAYLSKALSSRNQALSTYEKECLAIILAIEKWRPYLQYQKFHIMTDHHSLLHIVDQRVTSKIQHKALMKLMDLDFTIQYKKGSTVCAISECVPAWLQKLQEFYKEDSQAQQLLTELSLSPASSGPYTLTNGIIRFKGRVWIGSNQIAQQHIMQALHSSAVGGHSGITATYSRIKQLFYWPQMKSIIQNYVQSCEICQQAKSEHIRTPGLLQLLQVPQQAWEIVSLDFIEGLPVSDRFNAILVVIDKFTKYGHFIPIKHPFTALQIAQIYLAQVYKLHGLPKALISDRDRVFTSNVWQELFQLTDTKLLMSSSYHPQTDGQTKRLNQCLEGFLMCTVHSCPQQWNKWLPAAEFWYNTSYHSALGKSPFEVLYGYAPRHLGINNLQ